MKKSTPCHIALSAFLLAAVLPAHAEDWQVTFTPYVWASDIETTAGGSRVAATSKIDFDDVLPIVDAAWMSMLEARKGNWSLMNDTVYMKLSEGASVHSDLDFVSGANLSASFQQATVDMMAGYTPDNSHTTFFTGLRYNYLKISTKTNIVTPLPAGSFSRNGSRNEDWIDPVIGVRQVFPLGTALSATAQVDVGGGYDSEFSSVSTVSLNYAVSDSVKLRAGYRYARIDKDDDELLFDQTAKGVLIGAQFAF